MKREDIRVDEQFPFLTLICAPSRKSYTEQKAVIGWTTQQVKACNIDIEKADVTCRSIFCMQSKSEIRVQEEGGLWNWKRR